MRQQVLHVRFALLQIAQFLLHGWTGKASDQLGQMFEPVKHDLQPLGGQSASCCTYGLPNLIDVFGCVRKIENVHGICTMVVDQSLQPLRSILHHVPLSHLCRPFQPPPRCVSTSARPSAKYAASASPREGEICRKHTSPRLVRLLLEPLLLRLAHCQRRLPCRQRCSTCRRLAHLRYSHFRAQGLHVGSGLAEVACKTVVSTRAKRAGMRWAPEGLDALLHLRTAALNRTYDAFWQDRSVAFS